MKKLYALIKRECLENKWRFFLIPIWTVAIFLVLFYIQMIVDSLGNNRYADATILILPASMWILLSIYLLINNIFYPLQALYQDRKNGSIAFFKSMPYSSRLELLSKFLTISVVLTVFFSILFFVSGLLVFPLINWLTGKNMSYISLNMNKFYHLKQLDFGGTHIFLYELWFLSYMGYLFFCSSLAKRSPFFLAVTPWVIIVILEAIIYKSYFVLKVISYPLMNYNQSFISSIYDMYFWVSMAVAVLFFLVTLVVRKRFAEPL